MTNQDRVTRLEAMIADEPGDAELRYALAMEFVSGGEDAEAVCRFQQLLEVAPNYPHAYHQAGRALQRLNRIAEARTLLSQGAAIAQKQGDMHAAGEISELLQSFD